MKRLLPLTLLLCACAVQAPVVDTIDTVEPVDENKIEQEVDVVPTEQDMRALDEVRAQFEAMRALSLSEFATREVELISEYEDGIVHIYTLDGTPAILASDTMSDFGRVLTEHYIDEDGYPYAVVGTLLVTEYQTHERIIFLDGRDILQVLEDGVAVDVNTKEAQELSESIFKNNEVLLHSMNVNMATSNTKSYVQQEGQKEYEVATRNTEELIEDIRAEFTYINSLPASTFSTRDVDLNLEGQTGTARVYSIDTVPKKIVVDNTDIEYGRTVVEYYMHDSANLYFVYLVQYTSQGNQYELRAYLHESRIIRYLDSSMGNEDIVSQMTEDQLGLMEETMQSEFSVILEAANL